MCSLHSSFQFFGILATFPNQTTGKKILNELHLIDLANTGTHYEPPPPKPQVTPKMKDSKAHWDMNIN